MVVPHEGTNVLATLSWDLPAPDDVVEWDLWTSSSDPDALVCVCVWVCVCMFVGVIFPYFASPGFYPTTHYRPPTPPALDLYPLI